MAGCKARVRWGWHCLSGPSCQSSLKTFDLEAGTTMNITFTLHLTWYWSWSFILHLHVNGVEMVILASRPVGGYLGGKTAQGLDYLEQDSSLIIETDLCLFSSIICFFFSRVSKRIRWQLKVPGRELFTLVNSLLVSSHGQVEVRVGNILGSASPRAPVCVIRKPVCAKSSANFEANWKLVWLKDYCGNINPDSKSFPLP